MFKISALPTCCLRHANGRNAIQSRPWSEGNGRSFTAAFSLSTCAPFLPSFPSIFVLFCLVPIPNSLPSYNTSLHTAEHVGKSSLISTFVSRHFSDVVPAIMTRVKLPPDPQSNCTTTIIDSQHADVAIMAAVANQRLDEQQQQHSSGSPNAAAAKQVPISDDKSISSSTSIETNRTATTASSSTSLPGLDSVDVIVLVYDVDRDDALPRLENHWLPMIERCYSGELPVIVAGNKTDLIRKAQQEQQREQGAAQHSAEAARLHEQHQQQIVRSRQQVVTLMQRFRFVRQYIRCSAKELLHVDEIFLKAQQSVLYPIGPLYDLEEGRLSIECQRALRRIFRIYDRDHDGLLNHAELDRFQYETFEHPVYKRDLMGWNKLIQNNNSTEDEIVRDGKLTLAGFLAIFDVFVSQNRLEVPWQALRKFGYDDDLRLFIPESMASSATSGMVSRSGIKAKPWKLSRLDRRFLVDTFFQFDSDDDGVLSPENVADIFSVLPAPSLPPWHPAQAQYAYDGAFSIPKLPRRPPSPTGSASPVDDQSAEQTFTLPDSLSASGITIASGETFPSIDLSSVHRSSFPISERLSVLQWMSMWHMSSTISPQQTRTELYRLGHMDTAKHIKRKRSRMKPIITPSGEKIIDHLLSSREVRVLVFGSPGSGKTAILNALCGTKEALLTTKTRYPETSATFSTMMRQAKRSGNLGKEVAMEKFVVHFIFTEVPEAQAEEQAQRKKNLTEILSMRQCDLVMLTFDVTNSASLAYVKHMETTLLDDDMPRTYIATKADQMQPTDAAAKQQQHMGDSSDKQSMTVVDEAAVHCQQTELEAPYVTSAAANDTNRDQILEHLAQCCLEEPGVDRKQAKPYEEKKRKEASSRRRTRKMIWLGVGVGVAVAMVGYLWTNRSATTTKSGSSDRKSADRFGWLRNWFV